MQTHIEIELVGDPIPFIDFIEKQTTLYVLHEGRVILVKPPMAIEQNWKDSMVIRRDTLVQPFRFGKYHDSR